MTRVRFPHGTGSVCAGIHSQRPCYTIRRAGRSFPRNYPFSGERLSAQLFTRARHKCRSRCRVPAARIHNHNANERDRRCMAKRPIRSASGSFALQIWSVPDHCSGELFSIPRHSNCISLRMRSIVQDYRGMAMLCLGAT